VTRRGEAVTLPADALALRYRQSDLPEGWVIVEATFAAPEGTPAALEARMAEQLSRRDATQPVKERTAGSTFRNPAGHSSTGRADDDHALKAWSLIDAAGMRGARRGGAQMSEKHSNFLVNTGGATAADLDALAGGLRDVPALSGWRHDVFGADAIRLCEGRIALRAKGSMIEVVEL